MRYGGPIVYLIVYSFVLLAILVWVDSGSHRLLAPKQTSSTRRDSLTSEDVVAEAKAASNPQNLLRVLGVSKSYDGKNVVDDVSLGVSRDTLFALLGPNGAGKTTTFNMIRECASSTQNASNGPWQVVT